MTAKRTYELFVASWIEYCLWIHSFQWIISLNNTKHDDVTTSQMSCNKTWIKKWPSNFHAPIKCLDVSKPVKSNEIVYD